jgi:hypothetical protein
MRPLIFLTPSMTTYKVSEQVSKPKSDLAWLMRPNETSEYGRKN